MNYSPNGQFLGVGGHDQILYIYNVEKNYVLH